MEIERGDVGADADGDDGFEEVARRSGGAGGAGAGEGVFDGR